ncbi:AAA family ATPase [Azospirillum sp. RWY-5-1]|nr:AAA family ATPase [Azospirillum oleiclasticum]NYZ17883.1 AAA family ATPase [Azospirillum oleiclasticum]
MSHGVVTTGPLWSPSNDAASRSRRRGRRAEGHRFVADPFGREKTVYTDLSHPPPDARLPVRLHYRNNHFLRPHRRKQKGALPSSRPSACGEAPPCANTGLNCLSEQKYVIVDVSDAAFAPDAAMLEELSVRSLHLHTLATLLTDLVSGRAVGLDETGTRSFALETVEARSLLEWYRTNERVWSQPVAQAHLPALIAASRIAPPVLAPISMATTTLHAYVPQRVRIHRFGGVQEYDSADDLLIQFDRPVLLLEGQNGSGKTSILNAMVWCLTGKLHRAQRPPVGGTDPVSLRTADTASDPDDEGEEEEAGIVSTAVCPVPPRAVLEKLDGNTLTQDTWVEITFADAVARREVTVRRAMTQKRTGRPTEVVTGRDELRLDPVAFEVGTVMPGLLPHIQIGTESGLGKAIAELTGLAPLRGMVRHARRAKKRIEEELIAALEEAKEAADSRFLDSRTLLAKLIGDHPAIAPAAPLTVLASSAEADRELDDLTHHFQRLQSDAFADARTVLGAGFDPVDSRMRQELESAVGPALAALELPAIARLTSASRLGQLGKLPPEQIAQAEAKTNALRGEAVALLDLAASPALEGRMRLYVRVANWLRENGHAAVPDACPVCLTPFEEVPDPATGRPAHQHLTEALLEGRDFLEKTLAAWAEGAEGALARDLPAVLADAVRDPLPDRPADLLRAALAEELFDASCFTGVLAPLRGHAEALCSTPLAALPGWTEPPTDTCLSGAPALSAIDTALRRLDRAIAFARWRKAAASECATAFRAIVGEATEPRAAAPIHEQPLRRQIQALQDIVRAATPLATALGHVAAMRRELFARRQKVAEAERARKTAGHLEELFPIGDLVQEQLEALRRRLDDRTREWLKRLYQSATAGTAPTPHRADVDAAGKLALLVERGGTLVAAEHVGNASFLRAYLMAFLMAFWHHVLETRGGLTLLVFDDPQELMDPNNRHRLATTMGKLADAGASLLLATHDSRFALEMCAEMRRRRIMRHLSVHGRNATRHCAMLAPSVEALEEKRRAFRDGPQDDHQAARDYANEFRIFAEARLSDLFDRPAHSQPRKPTLEVLIGELSRLADAPGLSGPAFEALRAEPALRPDSGFRALLNRVHHGDAHTVTWNDVDEHRDLFDRMRRLVIDAHEEHRRWQKRDEAPRATAPAVSLDPMRAPSFGTLHADQRLAAFSGNEGAGGGDGPGEAFSDR